MNSYSFRVKKTMERAKYHPIERSNVDILLIANAAMLLVLAISALVK